MGLFKSRCGQQAVALLVGLVGAAKGEQLNSSAVRTEGSGSTQQASGELHLKHIIAEGAGRRHATKLAQHARRPTLRARTARTSTACCGQLGAAAASSAP